MILASGCTAANTQLPPPVEVTPVKEVKQEIDPKLLTCPSEDAPPPGMILGRKDGMLLLNDELASQWLGALIIAGRVCRGNLGQVRSLVVSP